MLPRCTARVRRARWMIYVAALGSIALWPVRGAFGIAHAEQPAPAVRAPTPAAAASTAPELAEAAAPRTGFWIRPASDRDLAVLAYPPEAATPRAPVMLMLHGMCDLPQNECPSFSVGATAGHWLLCPRANLRCDGGGAIWSGQPSVRYELVQSTMERMQLALAGRIEPTAGSTLVGFSLGSFVALDVAQRGHGQWKNLLLIGAKIEPDARLLTRAGVRNVLLASGDRDMMKWHMVGVAARLQRRGVRATFMSMGDVGHAFAPDMNRWMSEAMKWFEQDAS